jgi:hypothetical protein
MRKYCGFVIDRIIPFDANLISRDGYYSDKNLYCKWRGINRDKDLKIFFNLTIYEIKEEEKYNIEIIYFDGSISSYNIDSSNFYVTSSSINYINFHFYSPGKLSYSPFNADFGIVEDNNITAGGYLNIVFISGVAIFGCVVLTIFLNKCSSIIFQNNNNNSRSISEVGENPNNNLSEEENNNDPIFIREENMKKRNQEALDKLFLDETKKEKFEQKTEKEFCANCTICMEDFFPDSDVFTLTCRHAFHPICLKNWLSKILLFPKCPNCNKKILDYDIGEGENGDFTDNEIHYINDINNNININNDNNDNNNDNDNRNLLIMNRNLYSNINLNSNLNENNDQIYLHNSNTNRSLNNANTNTNANANTNTNAIININYPPQRNEGLNRSINLKNNSNLIIPVSVSLHNANLIKNSFDEGLSIYSNIDIGNNEIFNDNNFNKKNKNYKNIENNNNDNYDKYKNNDLDIDIEINNNNKERIDRNNFVIISKENNEEDNSINQENRK